MSGHNRWSKIKHKVMANAASKGKAWTKYIREITVAARMGGGDPAGNFRLRAAIDKARADNMPMDNVERAIKKGTGEGEAVNYEELTYEVYGPGGTALVLDILTDNRNRTASELRHLLERHNGKIGAAGSVLYQFKKRGVIAFDASKLDEDKLMEAALELGADDFQSADGVATVFTEPGAYMDIKDRLEKQGFKAQSGEVTMLPDSTIKLDGKEAESMVKLINACEDHDDIQNVYTNADIDAEVFERLSA